MPQKLRCTKLGKTFENNGLSQPVLENLDFKLDETEFLSLIGPSGCGKSTLLRIVAGLTKPSSGEVEIFSNDSGGLKSAMVFQDFGLFPWFTVINNVAFGISTRISRTEKHDRCQSVLDQFGLSEFANYYPHQLSGGMRQRVGIARAYVSEAEILLMDEPFGSLDAQTKIIMQEELTAFHRTKKRTILYVTHDIDEALKMSDRILVMSPRPGRIVDDICLDLLNGVNRNTKEERLLFLAKCKQRIWDKLKADVKVNITSLQ